MMHSSTIQPQEEPRQRFSCWQRFKNKIDDWVAISVDNPHALGYFRSRLEVEKEKRRQLSAGRFVIHPFSEFQKWYDMYRIYLYLSILVTVPLEFGFARRTNYYPRLVYGTYTLFTASLSWIDIFLNFFTGYVSTRRSVHLSRKEIANNYVYSPYFACDVLSSVPKLLFYHFIKRGAAKRRYVGAVNMISLCRIVRVISVMACAEKVSRYTQLKRGPIVLVQILIVLVILGHWLCCLQFGVPRFIRMYMFQKRQNDTWFVRGGLSDNNMARQYLHSFFKSSAYFLGARLTRAYEEKLPEEFLMGVFTYFIGKFVVALVWIVIAVTILNSRSVEIKFAEVINQLDEYMAQKQLPLKLRERISYYYQFKYKKKYLNEEQTTNYLSNHLKKDVNMHLCSSLIQNVSLFSTLNTDELSKVVHYLVPEIFLPNDVIIQSGTYGDAMYFISSGTVAVYTRSGKEICHLQDGAYFGEISLLLRGQTRMATVVAIEITQVYRLDKKNFDRCMLTNKKVFRKLSQHAKSRLGEATRLEEEYKKTLFEQTFQTQDAKDA